MWVEINVDDETWGFELDGAVIPQVGETFEVEMNGSGRSLRLKRRNIVYESNIVYQSDVSGIGSCRLRLSAEDAQASISSTAPPLEEDAQLASISPTPPPQEETLLWYEEKMEPSSQTP